MQWSRRYRGCYNMTEPKCNSVYCSRKYNCGRYESVTFKPYFKYDMSRPWLCFVPKTADDYEDEYDVSIFENHSNSLSIQMDIMEFDINSHSSSMPTLIAHVHSISTPPEYGSTSRIRSRRR